MEKRIEKLRDYLKEKGAGGAIITSFQNRFYYSGFSGSAGYLVVTTDNQYIVTDTRYTIQVKEQAKGFCLISAPESDYSKIAKTAANEGITAFCYEDEALSVANFTQMQNLLTGIELIPFQNSITEQRAVKDAEEIKSIREALRLADEAFLYTVSHIKVGMRETEVASIIEGYMRKNGAFRTSFDTIAASGIRSALPHGTATVAEIKTGDFLVMDYGCVLDGYCSDITRTVVVGIANEKQKEIHDTVANALLAGQMALMPTAKCADVDKKARDIIIKAGYGEYFTHSLGHGVGIDIHEMPTLSPKSEKTLKPGNVVTVEPGIYIENFGGVRIEDMALITQKGAEILTKSTRELIYI